jgi:hypothetical protein
MMKALITGGTGGIGFGMLDRGARRGLRGERMTGEQVAQVPIKREATSDGTL